MDFIVSAATDIGLTKKTNQDSYNVRVYSTSQGRITFAILCDGMGGLSNGEIASASVVKAFCDWADNQLPILCAREILDADIERDWTSIATRFNEKIKGNSAANGVSMGTTATVILLTQNRYYILNVGDTRAYKISNSVEVLTKDQTVVAREVELGIITQEQAKVDSRRSVLLQCIGASAVVCPDMFFGNIEPNAVYMLCSDGFRHEISEAEIYQYLNPNVMVDPQGMQANIETLINMDKQRQERDNITVVAIRTF